MTRDDGDAAVTGDISALSRRAVTDNHVAAGVERHASRVCVHCVSRVIANQDIGVGAIRLDQNILRPCDMRLFRIRDGEQNTAVVHDLNLPARVKARQHAADGERRNAANS